MTTTQTLDTEASAAQAEALAKARGKARAPHCSVGSACGQPGKYRGRAESTRMRCAIGCRHPFCAGCGNGSCQACRKSTHQSGQFLRPGAHIPQNGIYRRGICRRNEKLSEKFSSFLALCREHGTAIRIGVNHGSLSDRIMSRFGDGAEGMVESALEFMRGLPQRITSTTL